MTPSTWSVVIALSCLAALMAVYENEIVTLMGVAG